MKSFIPIFTGFLVAGSLLQAQETKLVDGPFLSALRTEAARNHPAASSGKLRATAAGRDILGVRLWDDPMVGLTLMAARASMRADDGDIRLSYEQPLPKPGLYQANLAKAEALHRAELENSRSSSLEVAAAAAKDAIELALLDESIALQTAQLKWFSSMAENASQMAQNPDGNSIDALRLESELVRENQILQAARRTRDSASRSLNLRLGRPLDSPWPALRLGTHSAPMPIVITEIARIPRVNPKVRSMKEMATAASAETRIATRERLPQFAVAVDANLYSGGDVRSMGLGLKMSLPYINRASNDAKIDASKFREIAATSDTEATRLAVASNVLTATTEAANAAAQARAYSGEIYQRALQATQAVEAAWLSSQSSLTDLLDSNRLLFSIRLAQRRFVAQQLAALEDLNLLVPNSH